MEMEHRVAVHMLMCDVASRKVSLGDRWVIRAEGGVGDECRLRYRGLQRVNDALYSRHKRDKLSRPSHCFQCSRHKEYVSHKS